MVPEVNPGMRLCGKATYLALAIFPHLSVDDTLLFFYGNYDLQPAKLEARAELVTQNKKILP
jgi:hypothetical protein